MTGKSSAWLKGVGVVLLLLGVITWIAPVAVGDEALVEQTVETKKGGVTRTEKSVGWGAVHSEEMVIALLGGGLVFITLGALPPGSLKSIKTVFGEVEFSESTLKQVVGEVAVKASSDRAEDVYEHALADLAAEHGVRGARVAPSRSEVSAAVERAIREGG